MFAYCSHAVLWVFILQRRRPRPRYVGGNVIPRLSFLFLQLSLGEERAWERSCAGGILKRRFHSENASNYSRLHRNLKRQQSLVILDLCLKNRLGEITSWLSRDHRFQKTLRFRIFFLSTQKKQKVGFFKYKLLQFGNSLLRSVAWHPKKRLRRGLVWGAFSRIDGLMWSVGLNVKVKLCFQIPPTECGDATVAWPFVKLVPSSLSLLASSWEWDLDRKLINLICSNIKA